MRLYDDIYYRRSLCACSDRRQPSPGNSIVNASHKDRHQRVERDRISHDQPVTTTIRHKNHSTAIQSTRDILSRLRVAQTIQVPIQTICAKRAQ